MFSKKPSRVPKPLAALLAAIAAAGEDVVVHEIKIPEDPFEQFVNGVRVISPRTYAEIQRSTKFSKLERDLCELMFHRDAQRLFTNALIGFCLSLDETHRARMRAAFPTEFQLVDIVLDQLKFADLLDRIMAFDQYVRSSAFDPSTNN